MLKRRCRDHTVSNIQGPTRDLSSRVQFSQRSAIDRVTERMRPENRIDKSVSIQDSSSVLRLPGDIRIVPLRSSPKLTALINKVSRSCASSQVSTFGAGRERTNSDGTLVSTKKPLIQNGPGGLKRRYG
jgi:hypothetical protein